MKINKVERHMSMTGTALSVSSYLLFPEVLIKNKQDS